MQSGSLSSRLCLPRLVASKGGCVFIEGAVRVGADCVLKSREVVLEITRQGCGSWLLEPASRGPKLPIASDHTQANVSILCRFCPYCLLT